MYNSCFRFRVYANVLRLSRITQRRVFSRAPGIPEDHAKGQLISCLIDANVIVDQLPTNSRVVRLKAFEPELSSKKSDFYIRRKLCMPVVHSTVLEAPKFLGCRREKSFIPLSSHTYTK
ncbi:uncharacterized protein PHALS_07260 [Plasmopara halstedii]|uniref:Uncharacterized protein n=1 Tax=Plasmopara halstedii TaxID=4781 RepID=A0A0N7L8C6_PLAHL|nr:uncharacterized protein PHALS_07260 [Plasmopara halstedii]CEG49499.1 hypothetical protein PHALS_07260 [Plasmopara halstedii]|eukprot:XP_024585868.1 hypothetical protein PHALS_07260 [Plasmopara halstedii]